MAQSGAVTLSTVDGPVIEEAPLVLQVVLVSHLTKIQDFISVEKL